ncbi:MAG TPA: tetraacyldisaccharide 4'-kinase [Saprospiraceae bacterium]|nr:tetraacyldisaccharide 4'-kinase [Saprospiraceae bacterium]
MVDNIFLKILLFPFSIVYGAVIGLRELMYRIHLLKGVSFDIPLISVGNLTVGGAGKTPHIEYLLRMLLPYIEVGTLSRGYKRKTSGYRLVLEYDSAIEAGDEPLQFKRKFKDVTVAVCENRVFAVPKMLMDNHNLQTILLDDAFQHRAIKPGLNILLTEYSKPFFKDFLLPVGRLREFPEAYKRANIIIVTKCPEELTPEEADSITQRIHPYAYQKVFFSIYKYQAPYFWFNPSFTYKLKDTTDIVLVSGIANSDYLVSHLQKTVNNIEMLEFADHHIFKEVDLLAIQNLFSSIPGKDKVILTTEKDAIRLELHRNFFIENQLPLIVLPVEVNFCFEQDPLFQQQIKEYLLNFKI